ncbi:MAG: DUF4219 domain-containing protein [Bacteroidota bacterium]
MSIDGKMFSDSDRLRVPLLNGTNYYIWSKKMELVLKVKGLWKFVDGLTDSTSSIDVNDSGDSKQSQDSACILLSIEDSFLSPVISEKDPAKVWKMLTKVHTMASEAHIEALQAKLYQMKMEGKEGVQAYANRIMDLRNKFAAAGESVDDKELCRTFFRGLASHYKIQGTVIREIAKNFDESVSLMAAAEIRDDLDDGNSNGFNGGESALLVIPHGNCQHCGRPGHQKDNCFHNPHCAAYKRYYKYNSGGDEGSQDSEKGLVSIAFSVLWIMGATLIPDGNSRMA